MTDGERIVWIIVLAVLVVSFIGVVSELVFGIKSAIDERGMQMQDEQQCENRKDAQSTREENFKNDRTEVGEHKDLGAWIPLKKSQKNWLITCCAEYGTDICLALAVMEVESDFDAEAVGAAGEVGMFQILPGENECYFAELEEAVGCDPKTEFGNIACGCWMLSALMRRYGDIGKAAMAYNMGPTGAKRAWDRGVTSTAYSMAVNDAYQKWNNERSRNNGTELQAAE